MARPKKDPAEKMLRVNLTLRRHDVQALQLLALERHAAAVVAAVQAAGRATKFRAPERPSVSYAIRYLIDELRKRRLDQRREMARRGELPRLPHVRGKDADRLTDEQILEGDPVFGLEVRSSEPAALDKLVEVHPPASAKPKPKRRR